MRESGNTGAPRGASRAVGRAAGSGKGRGGAAVFAFRKPQRDIGELPAVGRVCLLSCVLFLASVFCGGAPAFCIASSQPFSGGLVASTERTFQLPQEKEAAVAAALAMTRLALMEQLAMELLLRSDVSFGGVGEAGESLDVLVLAYAVAAYSREISVDDAGGRVRATLRQTGDIGLEMLRKRLGRGDVLDLYTRAVAREIALIRAYRLLTAVSALLPNVSLAGEDAAYSRPRDFLSRLQRGMHALDRYFSLLPDLEGVWQNPHSVLEIMTEAISDDPSNPLLHNAYGEAALQAGRPHEALDAQSAALRLDPLFARAYHARGVVYLALNLPALVVADFSEALALAPKNPRYWNDRAAAWRVRENIPNMCADFYQACALGDCQGYRWATEEKFCR